MKTLDKYDVNKKFWSTLTLLCALLPASFTIAQTTHVQILAADIIERDPSISDASRLIGDVKLGFGDAILTCDSAYRHEDGEFEVFSNVVVRQQPSTTLTSNYAVLFPDEQLITVTEGVEFQHEEMHIECNTMFYELETKSVYYLERSKIIEGNRTLESDYGTYRSASDRLYAGGNVIMIENDDVIISDSLGLDRNDKTLLLFKSSHLNVGGAEIFCRQGRFNIETGTGWFSGDASIRDSGGMLAGDSIAVSRDDNYGTAWGNVMVEDSTGNMTVTGVYANRWDDNDIVKGDTLQKAIATNIENGDTLILSTDELMRNGDWLYATGTVEFSQDSFAGMGDSLSWNMEDDEVWLLGNPVVWAKGDELRGDTVVMTLSDNKPSSLSLLNNALVLSVANDSLQNLISGKRLDARFFNGKLHQVDVTGNGNVEYYLLDDPANISINKATCSHIRMLFNEGDVEKIILLTSPDGSIGPADSTDEQKP
jgi:lipopolysaccharide assembly outer membrane protein LptD (OstA)